ncbi:MAG: APC family permease [Vulcanisaeta sp.]
MSTEVRRTQLRRGAVAFWHAVFQSFSFVAPAGDVAILLLGTAAFALGATPLAILLAWLIYGLWLVVPYEFSKYIVNAGSYYAYSARSSGPLGVMALWYWMLENLTGPAFGILGLAGFLYLISPAVTHIPYIWIAFALIIWAYGAVLSYLGIKPSLSYVMYTGFAEALFLFISALIIIAMLGSKNTWVVWTPAPLKWTWAPVFFGTIYSVLDFTGLGTATTISEEVRDPRRIIRWALITAWILSGLALIIPAYALTVGWGVNQMSTYATSPDPGLIVYMRYLGLAGWALLVAFTINSYFSYMVAKYNAVTRIWFSSARDGLWFRKLGLDKVHRRFRTPSRAILFFATLILIINIVTGLIMGPTNGAIWLLTFAGLGIIAVHIVANSALTIYSYRQGMLRKEWLKHGLIPTVASVLGAIIFFYSVYPLPSYPYNIAVIASFVWIIIGVVLAIYYWRKRPDILANAGLSYE